MNLQLRAESVNETERSIEAVLATENPVTVFDWNRLEPVDEVLLMNGCQIREQIPLLDNHRRWSLDDVFGSIRNMKKQGSQLLCRLYFADMSEHADDEEARRIGRAWTKVKQRHQREISVGYRVLESVTIPAGESAVVEGRKWKAESRPLRIATKWLPREGSLTPIAADVAAMTRKDEEMPPFLRYLVSIGLRSDATMQEAWTFVAGVTDTGQRSEIQRLLEAAPELTPPANVRSAMESWTNGTGQTGQTTECQRNQPTEGTGPQTGGQLTGGQRSEGQPGQQGNQLGNPSGNQGLTVDDVRGEIASERDRVTDVVRMFAENNVQNDALQQRAISEGWSPARVAQEILPMVRQRSSQPLDNSGHVGIHSVRSATLDSLSMALMVRNGTPLDSEVYSRSEFAQRFNPNGDFRAAGSVLARGIDDEQRQRAMEDGHRLASRYSSLVDICEMGLRAAGLNVPHSRDEMIRSALSSSAVQGIFTSDVNARLLGGYTTFEDTTQGWCRSEDRDDFKINEGHAMGKFKGLSLHSAGKTADHLDTDSESYSYKLYRFSGQFVLDEMDIINDRFGALDQMAPEDMGQVAGELRTNMVYAMLLANPTFNGTALFHASRNNLFSGGADAFGLTSLTDAKAKMAKQRIRERILNLRLKYLIAPFELEGAMDQLLNSIELRDTNTAKIYGTSNPVAGKGYMKVVDDRLSTAGVVDPITGTKYAGTATNWFGAAQPGQGGARTIVVGYRRGTGRAPQTRAFQLTQGRWGMGWDIAMDIGAGFEDYRCLQKHAGA